MAFEQLDPGVYLAKREMRARSVRREEKKNKCFFFFFFFYILRFENYKQRFVFKFLIEISEATILDRKK